MVGKVGICLAQVHFYFLVPCPPFANFGIHRLEQIMAPQTCLCPDSYNKLDKHITLEEPPLMSFGLLKLKITWPALLCSALLNQSLLTLQAQEEVWAAHNSP